MLSTLGRALNEADSLRAENVLLWQLIEDAAAIISEQQDVIDHQTKLLMISLDHPVIQPVPLELTLDEEDERYLGEAVIAKLRNAKVYDEHGEIVRDDI